MEIAAKKSRTQPYKKKSGKDNTGKGNIHKNKHYYIV